MEQVAIISDIHGNMTALEAVLDNIKERGINHIICLGDLVGKGPNSRAAIDRIKDICDVVVYGNWDDTIQRPSEYEVMKWHQQQLRPDQISYLSELPFHYDFYMSGQYVRVFHASAKSVHHRVIPKRCAMAELNAMFHNTEWITPLEDNREPDIVGYGDIHSALIEPIGQKRILFNAGSVGNPLDIPQATYVILHGEYQSKKPAPFSIEVARIPYDIEKEILIAKEMRILDLEFYEIELREAIYRGSISKAKQS